MKGRIRIKDLDASEGPVGNYSREIVHPYYLGYATSVPALVSKPVGYADSEILLPSGNAHASFQAETGPVSLVITVLVLAFGCYFPEEKHSTLVPL